MTHRPGSRWQLARVAGAIYVVTFVAGSLALVLHGRAAAMAGAIAGLSYVAVTWLFYRLFRPVSRPLSLLAACVSFAGILIGPLGVKVVNPLVFFGVYCLLIGYLIYRSTFLPRFLAWLLAFAGVGWLTYLFPAVAKSLYPYVMIPGMVGEGVLTLWLLIRGVDVARWKDQERPSNLA